MKINDKILEYLKEAKVTQKDGLCYLLAVYFDQEPSYIPGVVRSRVDSLGIFTRGKKSSDITWKEPLFNEQQTAFAWVKEEYVPLFKAKNSQKGGNVRESTTRMKKLFAENPEIRKEDIIEATKLYLLNTDMRFIRFPHFFIYKGSGADKTWDILNWIEKYNITKQNQQGRTSDSRTLK